MRSFAQDTAQPRLAAVSTDAASIDSPAQTRHAITVDGGQLDYIATAGTLRVRQDKGDAEAAVFYVSYRKEGEDAATRPVTFVFNGGPASSAAWLHMGALGPRRLALEDDGAIPGAPARLVDNAQTWLRFTDLVFIDPVGTGFSRAIASGERSSGEVGRRFWGVKSDLRSLAEFIRLYLTANDRWGSPKYLAGESYGGFRAAVLVDALPAQAGIELNGAILISPVIDYTLNLYFDYLSVMPWVTFVPSFAATAFQHGKYRGEGKDLKQITDAAETFSRGELLLTLVSGAAPNSPEVSQVLKRLAAIGGGIGVHAPGIHHASQSRPLAGLVIHNQDLAIHQHLVGLVQVQENLSLVVREASDVHVGEERGEVRYPGSEYEQPDQRADRARQPHPRDDSGQTRSG
jgi:carboxypeptidase C (cathepsin A)